MALSATEDLCSEAPRLPVALLRSGDFSDDVLEECQRVCRWAVVSNLRIWIKPDRPLVVVVRLPPRLDYRVSQPFRAIVPWGDASNFLNQALESRPDIHQPRERFMLSLVTHIAPRLLQF